MVAHQPETPPRADLPCAARSRVEESSLAGTASTVRRWVLVEQPGPWGPHAPHDSRMPADVAAALERAAEAAGARVLLIRRPGGRRPDETARRMFVAVSHAGGGWGESLALPSIEAAAEVDLEPLGRRTSVGGEALAAPLLLVCTNGAHDGCCAREGQPLVRALTAAYPERVWEASHVGGCRFAGSLVCLPEGVYYGWLDANSGLAAAEAHLHGRVHLPAFRGRSGVAMPVQAAEGFVREHFGLDALEAVRARTHRELGKGVHEVGLSLADGRAVTARLAVRRDVEARPLTCAAEQAVHPPRYELITLSATG
jgi:hypothetical protein